MQAGIKRTFDPFTSRAKRASRQEKARQVVLDIPKTPRPKIKGVSVVYAPDCEVTELHGEAAWEDWQDSVFLQEFESACVDTVPMELNYESRFPVLAQHDLDAFIRPQLARSTPEPHEVDPFASVTRNSA